MIVEFLKETMEYRRKWNNVHKVLREKKKKNTVQIRILNPVKYPLERKVK